MTLRARAGLAGASSAESDRYEALSVNPALLTQRGDIDAGGLRHLLVRYGNFFQLVLAVPGGHVSIALASHAVGVGLLEPITAILGDHSLIG